MSDLVSRLSQTRKRTLWLLQQVPDAFLRRRVHSFYSPIGWHFGHIGRTEEYWVIGEALRRPLLDDHLSFLFADLPENPKDNRVNIPDRTGIAAYLERTREAVLDALHAANLDSENPLLRNGYAWEFALQHECQHQETICEMLQLIQREIGHDTLPEPIEWKPGVEPKLLRIDGGRFMMGSDEPFVYDNEREPHEAEIEAFSLMSCPVTNFEWSEFMADGGYDRPELWSEEGWTWGQNENAIKPEYWIGSASRAPSSQFAHGPLGVRALHPDEPVCGVSWHEANAYANWRGLRLPTEQEWEHARRLDNGELRQECHGIASWSPSPITAGDAMQDLAGNVWEWTSSVFSPYPGFRAYPYDGYSKDHMKGEHRVCRGGSWATAAPILRPSFRNWYVPGYRQGFLGLRLAGPA